MRKTDLLFAGGITAVLCFRSADAVGLLLAEVREVDDAGNVGLRQENIAAPLGNEYERSTTSVVEPMPWSIIKELFPDTIQSLSDAWESHPVYLPTSSLSSSTQRSTLLPTALSNSTATPSADATRFDHLFQAQNLDTILSNPALIHGTDYIILKYIQRDGEEWNGQLPYDSVPLQDVHRLVSSNKAFSIVLNKVQDRWMPVMKFARSLELELLPHAVSCNLYLTPPGGARGFESHMDWMDVIVVQIAGEKDWTVWTEPLVSMVMPDEKRKPTMQELTSDTSIRSRSNVRLSPGDALYIPRGFLHNATTPSSPPTSATDSSSGSFSMHLTFGIEHNCDTTMEALLHHALHLFVEQEQDKSAMMANSIAVPMEVCHIITADDGAADAEKRGVTYETLLHLGMSEVIRRTNCGGFGETKENNRGSSNAAICALRRSVPLHPQLQKIKGRSRENVEDQYMTGLEAVAAHVSFPNAVWFMNKIASSTDFKDNSIPYCYPQSRMEDYAYHCNPDLMKTPPDFADFVRGFVAFSREKFMDARNRMMNQGEKDRMDRWKEADGKLDIFKML